MLSFCLFSFRVSGAPFLPPFVFLSHLYVVFSCCFHQNCHVCSIKFIMLLVLYLSLYLTLCLSSYFCITVLSKLLVEKILCYFHHTFHVSTTRMKLIPSHLSNNFLHACQVMSSTLIKLCHPHISSYVIHTYQVMSSTLIKLCHPHVSTYVIHTYQLMSSTLIKLFPPYA